VGDTEWTPHHDGCQGSVTVVNDVRAVIDNAGGNFSADNLEAYRKSFTFDVSHRAYNNDAVLVNSII
jgi:hypothetical protein